MSPKQIILMTLLVFISFFCAEAIGVYYAAPVEIFIVACCCRGLLMLVAGGRAWDWVEMHWEHLYSHWDAKVNLWGDALVDKAIDKGRAGFEKICWMCILVSYVLIFVLGNWRAFVDNSVPAFIVRCVVLWAFLKLYYDCHKFIQEARRSPFLRGRWLIDRGSTAG